MKIGRFLSIVILLLLCCGPVFADDSAPAAQTFNPQQRFSRGVDPIIAYRDAQNVVLSDVAYSDLPAFITSDIESLLRTCPDGSKGNVSMIRAFSYVSDMIRGSNLSPNYLLDFSAFVSGDGQNCGPSPMCKDGECLLVTYNSHDYEQWSRGVYFLNKSWKLGLVQDPRAFRPGIPERPLAVFDIAANCPAGSQGGEAECHSYYIWMGQGILPYKR